MEQTIIDKLKAKESKKYQHGNFITKLPVYESKVMEGCTIYFSECDFNTGESLKEKDLISFYARKDNLNTMFIVSKHFLTTDIDTCIEYVLNLIKKNFITLQESELKNKN